MANEQRDGASPHGGEALPPLGELRQLAEEMGREQWRCVSDVAQVVAHYLRCHPAVEEVRYPGLKSDPLFAEAARTLVGGFGPIVSYRVSGGWERLSCSAVDARELVMELEASLAKEEAQRGWSHGE